VIQVKTKVPADQDVQLQKLHARLICLPWHQGRHHASYSAMLAAASLGVSEATALPIIAHYMKRAGRSPEVGELERQWPNAKTHVSQTSGTDSSEKTTPSRKPVLYDGDFLRAFIKPLDVVSDIESYLKERSPLLVDTGPGEYLSTIFPSPEKSVFFNNLMSRGWLHPDEDIPDLISYFQPVAPEGCEAVRNETGMWYLSQPVNGEERINSSGKSSIRSEENVVSFKHLVTSQTSGSSTRSNPNYGCAPPPC
jgi:hypothetical protein